MEIKFKEPKKEDTKKETSVDKLVSECATELMNSAVSFHKLHLKITGNGSYAAHKALNDAYDAMPGHADELIEGYQGATETLVSYTEKSPKTLRDVKEAISYAEELKTMITSLQGMLSYSEIINELDTTKSTLNSLKYKLKFLS